MGIHRVSPETVRQLRELNPDFTIDDLVPVSYTHLDVYKRQGKWHLARQLMADDSHDRERVLGLSTLPVSIDCRAISAGDQPLWLAFARHLLVAMSEAADRAGYALSLIHI